MQIFGFLSIDVACEQALKSRSIDLGFDGITAQIAPFLYLSLKRTNIVLGFRSTRPERKNVEIVENHLLS